MVELPEAADNRRLSPKLGTFQWEVLYTSPSNGNICQQISSYVGIKMDLRMGSLKWLTVFFEPLEITKFCSGWCHPKWRSQIGTQRWLDWTFPAKQPFRDGYQWLQLGPRFVHWKTIGHRCSPEKNGSCMQWKIPELPYLSLSLYSLIYSKL